MDNNEKLHSLRKLESLVEAMDSQFSIGGFTFGIDGLIGLIPGFGDMAGGLVSVYLLLRIRSIGVSDEVLNKMMINVLLDVFVGSIPVLGDLFDFLFKVNERNLKLAKRHLSETVLS